MKYFYDQTYYYDWLQLSSFHHPWKRTAPASKHISKLILFYQNDQDDMSILRIILSMIYLWTLSMTEHLLLPQLSPEQVQKLSQ